MAGRPKYPGPWRGPQGLFRSRPGFDNSPKLYSLDPNSDRVDGGVTVTLVGANFRYDTDGSAPLVTFGGVAATGVVVVNAFTLTAVAPVFPSSEVVDVTVTQGSQSATLVDAFTYYSGTITSLSPAFGPIAGGTDIVVHGVNFVAGSTFTFDGVAGTNVVFIDEEHYAVTTPANALPVFADVVVTEPGNATTTFRNGFKYTTLTRGNDLRRLPGIQIRDVLNQSPNTCSFTIDGASNRPQEGEEIEIVDHEDGDRQLFKGNVQTVDQEYEEQRGQLVWRVTIIDFTWLLNAKRPFGTYENISASEIVVDLITKYALGFTVTHVQTLLAPISVTFDGTKDFSSCLSEMAAAIGGGHWYVDYQKDIHFFHTKPPALRPLSPLSNGPGTAITLSEGLAMPNTLSFPAAYIYVRTTFLYSNGVESRLGPTSNVLAATGLKQIHFAGVPIGVDPGGSITVVARRVYFGRGTGPLTRGWKVNDNTTTDFDSYFNAPDDGPIHYEGTAGLTVPILPPPPVAGAAPVVEGGDSVGYSFSASGTYRFRVAAVYEDGTETIASELSNSVMLNDDFTVNNTGHNSLTGALIPPVGKGPAFTSLPLYPEINGVAPAYYKVFFQFTRFLLIAPGQTGPFVPPVPGPDVQLGTLPYDGSLILINPTPDFGVRPRFNTTGVSLTWPNPDGPVLEDTDPPEDIDDANTSLLREPKFTSSTDMSQIRNRVTVMGAGTITTEPAFTGDSQLQVADVSIFSEAGGQLIVNGHVITYFAPSSFEPGEGALFLTEALPFDLEEGAGVRFYMQVNDLESQEAMARLEGTDGIHESVISDTNMLLPQQMYIAANAELELFSRPVVTIKYGTRDPKTKSGQMVHVDLSDPPCNGDFLIQDVTIDQFHDESDTLLPRYTVTASSVKFELNDLLLQILKTVSSGTQNLRGVVKSAVAQSAPSSTDLRSIEGYHLPITSGNHGLKGIGIQLNNGGTAPTYDASVGSMGKPPTTTALRKWLTYATTAVNLNQSFVYTTEWFYPEWNFETTINILTGPNLADMLLFIGFSDAAVTGASPTSGTPASTKLIAFRYSSVDLDQGWVGFMSSNAGGSAKTAVLAAIAPNTEYALHIRTQLGPDSSTYTVSFKVDDGDWVTLPNSAASPVATGLTAAGLPFLISVTARAAAIKKLSWRRLALVME